MIEVESQDFTIKLVLNIANKYKTDSNYIILLAGHGNGEANQNFYDVIKADAELDPFYSLWDVMRYADGLANFWRLEAVIKPYAAINKTFDLSLIWRRFALAVDAFIQRYGELEISGTTENISEQLQPRLKYQI